ncbi:MBL fold metallo-hydrolase [Peteryoungia algae]|uniref:MBL fold metallo-hydrolase n=1 Tax=Peteryoungia algae TaxID=2919917 RepID=A0ABT0CYP9_9HYPH|nr:MBL fold metallo-hydrolase [Rhizobium sp. SSM4.3]MCJ8238297.1 MBL fold metallo-hydrolase [Rhizobium sp. SSM4.3]
MMLRLVLSTMVLAALASGTFAQEAARPQVSQCQLIAEKIPDVQYANYTPSASGAPKRTLVQVQEDVVITYLGHSTFQIDTPGGVSIATDFNGWLRTSRTPDVVTMNKAHSSHYTLNPDPAIGAVLQGWNEAEPGQPIEHKLVAGDAYVRNVSTDIRSWGGEMEPNGNSIFIVEVAGLCIGHLGHLHHELTDTHYGEIGRLDILMVPVDGGLTLGADSMSRIVKRLRSAVVLPMHRRGPPIETFLSMFDGGFDTQISENRGFTVSMRTLPKKPLILVLQGV